MTIFCSWVYFSRMLKPPCPGLPTLYPGHNYGCPMDCPKVCSTAACGVSGSGKKYSVNSGPKNIWSILVKYFYLVGVDLHPVRPLGQALHGLPRLVLGDGELPVC